MTLLNPIWLWALGGLAIPIAIHLLSRKEGKTIRIGSIRFLTETTTSKFSSIRLNEVALLTIRSLLIILIVLFLANLLVSSSNRKASYQWVLLEKGLENNEVLQNLLDSLQKDNYEIRNLSAGFPLPHNDTITQPPDYYMLTERLSQIENLKAIVIAGNTLENFKGKRIALPDNVKWLAHPISSSTGFPADSHLTLDTVKITLAYDPEFQVDKKILVAALQALQAGTSAEILIEETEINDLKTYHTDWLIWLSDSKIVHTGNTLHFKVDAINNLLVQESRSHWLLTKRLQEENAITEHLPVQLANMLFGEPVKHAIHTQDKRTAPDEMIWSNNAQLQVHDRHEAGKPISKVLIILIVALFIVERVFAFYRKQ